MKNYKYQFLFLFLALFFTASAVSAQSSSDIIGSWSLSSVGPTNYKDQTTGALTAGRGSSFTYKFKTDGTFEYIGYMEVTNYNCTTSMFNHKTGKYTLDGANVTLKSAKNHWKYTSTCAARGNSEKDQPLGSETYKWQVGDDETGRTALALDGGKGWMVFRQDKE